MKRYITVSMLVLAVCAPAFAGDGESDVVAAYLAKKQVVASRNLASEISSRGHTSCYIAFVPGTARLDVESQAQVHEIAHMLREDPDLKIEIAFQGSDLGEKSSRMAYRRAMALATALHDLNIVRGRVVAKSSDAVSLAFNDIVRRF